MYGRRRFPPAREQWRLPEYSSLATSSPRSALRCNWGAALRRKKSNPIKAASSSSAINSGKTGWAGASMSSDRPSHWTNDRIPSSVCCVQITATQKCSSTGRLQSGFTPEQAQAEMTAMARQLEQAWPQSNSEWGASVVPLAEQRSSKIRRALLVLQGAVGFVLLIACVNLANLLLARVTRRAKELAIRAALGAGELRLIWLFLSESVWLAALGGLGGLLLALWFVNLLPALAPRELANLGEVSVDGWVLGFTLLLSLLTLFFFSLAPLWQLSRTSLNEVLKDTPSAPRGNSLRGSLVIAEVTLTFALLVGAGLMLRSLLYLHNVPLGFNAENLLMMQASLPRSVPDQKIVGVYQEMLAQIEALPGVQSAALTSSAPLSRYLNF